MSQDLLFSLYIFVLAGFLGHHVISKVPHLLHTPIDIVAVLDAMPVRIDRGGEAAVIVVFVARHAHAAGIDDVLEIVRQVGEIGELGSRQPLACGSACASHIERSSARRSPHHRGPRADL